MMRHLPFQARRWLLAWLLVLPLLGGCSSQDLSHYQGQTPQLKLEQFFDGRLVAHGMVQDRSGTVLRRFKADLVGRWQTVDGKPQGVLDEVFYWDDGEQSTRIWYLTVEADGSYSGRADDVVGVARGQAVGAWLGWRYDLQLPESQGGWQITLDDTMVLIDETQLLNVATMSKWGFEVGTITLQIRKLE